MIYIFALYIVLNGSPSLDGLMWLAVVFAPLVLCVIPWREPHASFEGACSNCGYSRSGLPADAACPECGVTTYDIENRRAAWDVAYRRRLNITGAIFIASSVVLFIGYFIVRAGVALAYVQDGFEFARGWTVAEVRELHASRNVLGLFTLALLPPLQLLAFHKSTRLIVITLLTLFLSGMVAATIYAAYLAPIN